MEFIIFLKDKVAKVGNCVIHCPAFSWLNPLGIKAGVVLQPAAQMGVMLYDYEGNKLWENKELFGHIAYQENYGYICSYCSVENAGKITIVSAKDGKTIATADIPEYACAFINDNKTLVCNTGKMYDVSSGSIRKIETDFEFVVG